MDKTSVMINNGSNKTITTVGIDEIIITGDKNEKEFFTCIGCCSRHTTNLYSKECDEMLMKSWGEITNDHLESAWNIPQVIDIINRPLDLP